MPEKNILLSDEIVDGNTDKTLAAATMGMREASWLTPSPSSMCPATLLTW